MPADHSSQNILEAVQSVKSNYAPDPHLKIFNVSVVHERDRFVLKGEVENPAAKKELLAQLAVMGVNTEDQIQVLPAPEMGDRSWGIAMVSVVNVREKPGNPSEMGTQILTGNVFRVWEEKTNWFLVQTPDGYPGWTEGGGFYLCTREEADAWNNSPLLIVTAFDERILEEPDPEAFPISDVVMGGLVKYAGQVGIWLKVQLPDGRIGYMPKSSAVDYAEWRASRHATPGNIERTAKSFLGRRIFGGQFDSRNGLLRFDEADVFPQWH